MPYPETTDAFAVTDIKKWSTFKRQEVSLQVDHCTTLLTRLSASFEEVRGP